MIDYNLIMLIGISFIIGGFLLFIYCEHKIRQCDIADFKNEQLSKSFNKQKEKKPVRLSSYRLLCFTLLSKRRTKTKVGHPSSLLRLYHSYRCP